VQLSAFSRELNAEHCKEGLEVICSDSEDSPESLPQALGRPF
jgi:hypothetical protein